MTSPTSTSRWRGRRAGVSLPGLVVGALLAVLVTGCAGDPEPKFGESSSAPITLPSDPTSSDPSSDPTADPLTAPEIIREWARARNEMQVQGDTEEYRSLSMGCTPCSKTADLVERIYRDGGFIETDGWQLTKIRRNQGGEKGGGVFAVDIQGASTRYQERRGGPIETLAAGKVLLLVTVLRKGNELVVSDFVQVAI